jgi:hypothetical protein
MAWIERAMERMYGDINLTDELVDDEAEVLLKWGEAEHAKLETGAADEAALEEKAASVRKVMKRVNGLIGKWGGSDSEKAQKALAKLVDALADLGYDVAAEQVEGAISGSANNMSALLAVLALLQPPTPETEPNVDPDATKPSACGLDDLLEKPTDTDDPLGAIE